MSTTPTTEPAGMPPPVDATTAVLRRVLGTEPEGSAFAGNSRVFVPADRLVEVLTALRDECGFAMLAELGATDYLGYPGRPPGRPRYEVHYVLRNLDTNAKLVVKAGADEADPALPTVVPLWQGADWMEREVFDMCGIRFQGHPDLRRILMPDEFTAFPLRKDYPLRGRGERHNFPRLTRGQS
jgi:NADH-quinone oxidoreductase subunit C